MKQCPKCGEVKPFSEFGNDSRTASGYTCQCKRCRVVNTLKWRDGIKTKDTPIVETKRCPSCKNVLRSHDFGRADYTKDGLRPYCKKCTTAKTKAWQTKNPEKRYAMVREWERRNPERHKAIEKKRSLSIKRRLRHAIGFRIWKELKGKKCKRRVEDLVGYDIKTLKLHLENQFKAGMSWDNYGSEWHIDHKIPVSAFNFSKPEHTDFQRCWDLKNLQPLWAHENLTKHAKLERPFQPCLQL